ncbi:MAG: Alpha,alpha-trehalose-phosphate synthase [UDP-forming], partial [uncultured Acetobacteraceae bacterium]
EAAGDRHQPRPRPEGARRDGRRLGRGVARRRQPPRRRVVRLERPNRRGHRNGARARAPGPPDLRDARPRRGRLPPLLPRLLQRLAVADPALPPRLGPVLPRRLRRLPRGERRLRRGPRAAAAPRRPGVGARLPPVPAGRGAAAARLPAAPRLLPARALPAARRLLRPAARRRDAGRPGRLRRDRPANGGRRRQPARRAGGRGARRGRLPRVRLPHRDRRRRLHQAGGARGREAGDGAIPPQPGRARAGDRRGPAGLLQGPAAALRRLRGPARALPQPPFARDLPASDAHLARRCGAVPGAAAGVGRAGGPHQRRLRRAGLGAAPLHDARRAAPDARRLHAPRESGTRHAAPRRHEPRRQGVCRGAGPGRSGGAGAVPLRRRGALLDGRAAGQPARPGRDRRSAGPGDGHAVGGTALALAADGRGGARKLGAELVPGLPGGVGGL